MSDAFVEPLPGRAMSDAQAQRATEWWEQVSRLLQQPALGMLWQRATDAGARAGSLLLGVPDAETAALLQAQRVGAGTLERLVRDWGACANEAARPDRVKGGPPARTPSSPEEAGAWVQRAAAVRALVADPAWPTLCVVLATLAYAHADMARTGPPDGVMRHNVMLREIEGLCELINEWSALGPEAERWLKERGTGEESHDG